MPFTNSNLENKFFEEIFIYLIGVRTKNDFQIFTTNDLYYF